jgi:hypothetical protein
MGGSRAPRPVGARPTSAMADVARSRGPGLEVHGAAAGHGECGKTCVPGRLPSTATGHLVVPARANTHHSGRRLPYMT